MPGISRTLLSTRLRTLERAGIIECQRDGARNQTSYRLTPAGRDLKPVIEAMNEWGSRWGEPDPEPDDLDPLIAICMLKSRMRTSEMPAERVVIEVAIIGDREARAWLVCERQGVSMCFDDPGFDIDLWVKGDVQALYSIWLQRTSMAHELKCGRVDVDGGRDLVKQFGRWFDAQAV